MTSLSGVRVLAVDDNEELLFALQELLLSAGCEVQCASDGEQALQCIATSRPDIVLLDVVMPVKTGLDVLDVLASKPIADVPPVILVSSKDEASDIRRGIEKGAVDYVSKPYRKEELLLRLEMALEDKRRTPKPNTQAFKALGMHGESAPLEKLMLAIEELAPLTVPVVIFGETGAGKDLVARALHAFSNRSRKSFLAVNCANFSATLLTSELFGHVRGAFTGADTNKAGLFEAAHGGVLFLDEIGELDSEVQARLLRVLQEGSFIPVGGNAEKRVDVRIVAATHRDLEAMVREGTFREDLWFRLKGDVLRVPSLRERRVDIPLLFEHFIRLAKDDSHPFPLLSGEAQKLLCDYHWPGNVRELRAEAARVMLKVQGKKLITPSHLSDDIAAAIARLDGRNDSNGQGGVRIDSEMSLTDALAAVERSFIGRVLSECGGNKSQAAKELGISRSNLIAKVKQYELE